MNSSKQGKRLTKQFFDRNVLTVAPDLLGKIFCKLNDNGTLLRGKIVEVEAYSKIGDEASHSFKGESERNKAMFMGAGHLYVYFIYGMYYCANIVTGEKKSGCAVLIRGIEPIDGIEEMNKNRFKIAEIGSKNFTKLTNGPGKICSAFAITKNYNGINLFDGNIFLQDAPSVKPENVEATTRIGIKKSAELPWRFYIKDNPFVSRRKKV